jgi:hypothetical protein
MRVICPFVKLPRKVVIALNASGYKWERISVADSDEAYFEVLTDLWSFAEDFALVEHDVIVGPDTLRSFDECPLPWCVAPYPYLNGMYGGLGCVRFRTAIMGGAPGVMYDVGRMETTGHAPKHWCTLDAWLQTCLQSRGFHRCFHAPVTHLHDWPTHGCVPRP